jgi:hypothetical protein
VQTSAFFFRPLLLLAAAVGAALAIESLGRDRATLLLVTVAVPFLILFVLSSTLVKATARYALATLPAMLWLVSYASVRLATLPGLGRGPLRVLLLALLPLLIASDHLLHLVDYYGVHQGQRAPWQQAAARLRELAGNRPLLVWTVNQPTLIYYLRREQWRTRQAPLPAEHDVWTLESWMVDDGQNQHREKVCEPGLAAHLQMLRNLAASKQALFVAAMTRPELIEKDPRGEIRAALHQDFELVEHYPCWIGPKDESIYLYLPKQP